MKNLTAKEDKKDKETPRVDSNIKPQMCAKSPILDPVSKRDNEYKEALNSINNMTKRKRKLDKEDNNQLQSQKTIQMMLLIY